MYGYIVVDQPELKFREFDKYRSYYCGLCDSLAEAHGLKGQISLSYDMTFLVILLTGSVSYTHLTLPTNSLV